MTKTITRAAYMAHDITHAEYYGAIVECLGETAVRALLPAKTDGPRTPEDWRALLAQDEHFNALSTWDAKHDAIARLASAAPELRAITGSGGWSRADSVCTLKEAARRVAADKPAADEPITIARFIQDAADAGRPFKFRATRINARPDRGDEWDKTARHWRITITRDGRQMRLHYSQGSAIKDDPTLEDVLDCVAMDAAGINNAQGFEDWCSEYGYDTDSRKAERVYLECVEQAEKLAALIGDPDEYDRLLFNTERL